MESRAKINYNFYPKKRTAAKAYLVLNKKFLTGLLKFIVFLGSLSFVGLVLNLFVPIPGSVFLLANGMIFGVASFILFVFIRVYLAFYDNEYSFEGDIDLGLAADYEVTSVLKKTDYETPDINSIITGLTSSKRVMFVLNEVGAGVGIIEKISKGLPATPNQKQLFNFVVEEAVILAKENRSKNLSAVSLFFGFLKLSKNFEQILLELEISEKDLKNLVFWSDSLFYRLDHPKKLMEKLRVKKPGIAENWSSGYTLDLDRYSYDLSMRSADANFSIGPRTKIVDDMEEILSRDGRCNCLLVGPMGVGKSTFVSELARRAYWGESRQEIAHWRIVKLDLSSLITTSRGSNELQAKLVNCLNDAATAGNVILFIDDIHNIFSGGKEGTVDVSEIIGPYLQASAFKIIGTTTDNYYQTYIASKPALAGVFSQLDIKPTDPTETIRILEDLSLYFSQKYHLKITYQAIKELVTIADKYPGEKEFPARAIDLFEEVCSAARNRKEEVLTKEVVCNLVQQTSSLPVSEATGAEKEKLLKMEELIHGRVIGQEEAVSAVSNALRRVRANVTNTKRPIGSFLFLGPTGVGKTELAKALAWAYFGDENAMIRMDMSEYQDRNAIDRFLGKKRPGVEELEGGDFVKKVRENPFSLILLDEIEKASTGILDLFLQVLDEGFLTDGMGKRVSLSSTIIIATSNAGSNTIRNGVAGGRNLEELGKEVLDELQNKGEFRPEFLNRFDGVILFKPLNRENLFAISDLMFKKIQKGFTENGYKISVEEGLLEKLAEEGFQPELGARPMRRVFQDRLENYLADQILKGQLEKGKQYKIKVSDIYTEVS